MPGGYFDNFLLKVNGKIGGLNAVVDPALPKQLPFNVAKTMFVGVDVNHPSETERLASSVAVAVGSVDPMFSCYTASIKVQKKERDEILKHLDSMILELLTEYHKVNKYFPENLVIFRDGVSEGMFDKVLKTEIPLIQAAINKTGNPMKFTVIVTQKHHNTRFALTQCNMGGRKPTWNVASGTVVDNTIVEPLYKMFYLNSHFSPLVSLDLFAFDSIVSNIYCLFVQGTSRPTKYVILRDDLNMNADTVQKLCFILCYNSIRTRGVLAIPTPVRYGKPL